ncbi:efflux RND transporter periplasmic adaptor subunit [Hymenobacter pini]|uniref:biotin/lipoyl-binding protein n=1 Tax=Hymenobacter pini TaxID=2880879 RepID=UPI001CF4E5BA|nr:biotin/lipoyl-binding protein [Hymenobacter pini]MCA8832490.1 efflux RND transporter periplasmic adaptor subunit [Hymenobacter pini]
MKKLVGLGLVLMVATGSALLPLWLPASDAQANSLDASVAYFQPVVRTVAQSVAVPVGGQPILTQQGGRVHETYVHDGQRVQKGQVLVKLLERLPSVQQQQLQQRLLRQQQAYAALQRRAAPAAELATARQQLEDTRQQLAHCVPMLSFVYVTAPADGVVQHATATLGAQLAAGAVVAHLAPVPAADTTLLLTSVE